MLGFKFLVVLILIIYSLTSSCVLEKDLIQEIQKHGFISLLPPVDEYFGWITDFLPRAVAASVTYHIAFCCMFVGLVHLKWIQPK